MNIENKTVLITGANRGIGRALVQEALQRGAKRIYGGTRGPLHIADERVTPLTLDVTIDAQIEQAVRQAGSLDVLINNSGIAPYDDLSDPAVQGFAGVPADAEALQGGHRQQPVPGGSRSPAGYTLLLDLEGCRVEHDAVSEGARGR